ncbi:MAG: metallophosphoesterase [Spirochaetales bacterium]|nr:metallophosphoesterase [Spirochaetales bacterium]
MKRILMAFCLLVMCVSCISVNRLINKELIEFDSSLRSSSESWTMALIPDIQTYVKFARNQEDYYTMMRWLRENQDRLNIQLALFVGDLVEHNDRAIPAGAGGDQTSTQQWESFRKGATELLDVMPVIVCAGNHDLGYNSAEHRGSFLNSYLNSSSSPFFASSTNGGLLESMWDDPVNGQTLQNAFYKWKSPDGRDFHILSLEFAPRREAVAWGQRLLEEVSDDSIGILLTHSFLSSHIFGNIPKFSEFYKIRNNSTSGRQLWQSFIKQGTKVDFVFSGHVASNEDIDGQVGFRQDYNASGNVVNQMMFNAQRIGGWDGSGGDGWLRLLEFLPDGKSVIVRTYSPVFERDGNVSFRSGSLDYFSIKYR